MNLVVRKPGYRAAKPATIDQLFDNFFNRGLNDFFGNDFVKDSPAVNILEKEDHFRIELAAPGLDKGDFDVKVEKDHLVITAKKETSTEEKEAEKFVRREFSYTSFQRSFRLSDQVNPEGIVANYENGVLVINLPKLEESKTSRVIEIK